VLLQIPEGLKRKALALADSIKGQVLISCESCYGSCDLRISEAAALGCEKIMHCAHSKLISSKIPVEYIERRTTIDPVPILKREFKKIAEFERFGLITSLQFLDCLPAVRRFLQDRGKTAIIGKGKLYPGQVLGCELSAALSVEHKIDCFLAVASGKFHPLGVALASEKPVLVLDLEQRKISDICGLKELILRQRYAAAAVAKEAMSFGILISTKPGQTNLRLAERIKKQLERAGKKAYLLVLDEIKPEKLPPGLDAYVNTACPRIAIEDRSNFKKPILNPDELSGIFK
jgi:2-(3-amino-3-carboxypropyl)histidine synthase